VAVGSETLDALGVRLGDHVTGKSPVGNVEYRIVGRVVVPTLVDPQAVADGAVFTGAGLLRLETPDSVSAGVAPVVRFRGGVDVARAGQEIDRLPGVGRPGGPGLIPPPVPLEVERVQQIDRVPLALAAFLTILGAVAVGHLLVTSVQRRQRDFAILKSIGFGRRQLYATVAVQATTVAVVGVVVGLVAGVAAGSVLWRGAADRVGVLAQVEIPVLALALIALATVVIANVVAAFPARRAARTQAAVVLRTD
jgi:putative ABC transport system permease protein